jgi:RNA polymerase sigma-70 factor (ECF subfamily)
MSASFSERLLGELASLLRVARRLTRTEADAEDLVQATIVRAIERRSDLRDRERMRGWLLQVQRTVHLNAARGLARKLEVLKGGLSEAEEPYRDPHADLVERGFADELDDALGLLAPELRDALLLREVEELGYEEIAEVQRCPIGTVRSRLARARRALLDALTVNDGKSSWQAATKTGSRAYQRGATER